MRERCLQGFGQHMHAIGRGVDPVVQGRRADSAHAAGGDIHHRQLRGTVIGEQLLIVRAGERIACLVGAALAAAAQRLLHVRAARARAAGRCRALVGRHQLDQQLLATAQPLHRAAEDRVELYVGNLLDLPGRRIAHPQLHGSIHRVLEREALAVRRPLRRTRAALRQRHLGVLGSAHIHQGEIGHAGRDSIATLGIVAAAVLRLQAHAGQLEVRLGNALDRRIGLRGGQQQALAAGVQAGHGRRWRLEHLEQVFRRFVIAGESRRGGQQAERGNGDSRSQRGTTDQHPYPLAVVMSARTRA
ncbi:hypothetical protein D3C71_649020 [compost metagenome]